MTITKYEGALWGIPAVRYLFDSEDYEKGSTAEKVVELLGFTEKNYYINGIGIFTRYTEKREPHNPYHPNEYELDNIHWMEFVYYKNSPEKKEVSLEILVDEGGSPLSGPPLSRPLEPNLKLVEHLDSLFGFNKKKINTKR